MKIGLAAAALALLLPPAAAHAQCPPERVTAAEESVFRARESWDALREHQARYGACDDGAVYEGYSEAVVGLLADAWATFPRLVKLAEGDARLWKFVLKHVDDMIGPESVRKIRENAVAKCPAGMASRCKEIADAAAEALRAQRPPSRHPSNLGRRERLSALLGDPDPPATPHAGLAQCAQRVQTTAPYRELERRFPGSLSIHGEACALVEFCPDNTCDAFRVGKPGSAERLVEAVYLYEYGSSEYLLLQDWHGEREAGELATALLASPSYAACRELRDREAARCAFRVLACELRIVVTDVRYDEGVRNETPRVIRGGPTGGQAALDCLEPRR